MVYDITLTVLILVILLVSTKMDICKRELPIEMFALIVVLGVVGKVFRLGPDLFETLFFFIVIFLIYLCLALFFGGGGGDVIMMASLAFCLGKGVLVIVTVATVLMMILQLVQKFRMQKVKEIPYAPFVLLGFLVERMIAFC